MSQDATYLTRSRSSKKNSPRGLKAKLLKKRRIINSPKSLISFETKV
ncbi:MAG: hypothetical protein LBR15_06905 [Methanobrevibacter sp.]|nr:hypothetical protein [Candidatus Methanovirga australis]